MYSFHQIKQLFNVVCFDHECFFGAGQPGQVSHDRDGADVRLWRDENRELHVTVIDLGRMPVETNAPPETLMLAQRFHGDQTF